MEIVFIGAGRLATNLAKALTAAGHTVAAVYSRTLANATALSSVVGGSPTDSIQTLPDKADAFILSVKDSAIAELLPALRKGREHQAFFHTSGSVPLSVFGGLPCCGVVYPMQTFSKERQVDFSRVPIYIEGSCEQAVLLAEAIARSVSNRVERLGSEERRRLHLAAVFACNFANHCYALAAEVLAKAGIPFDAMLPIIEETAAKVHEMSPRDAQTGPAIRYDEQVIEAHLQLLQDEPQAREVYRIMSESIHQLSTKK